MKKIFILTGEPSGDKLASVIISKIKSSNTNIEFLSVGGEHIKSLGIKTIYDLDDITYLGFTKVLFNIFKITNKINLTTRKIVEFNPDILFSVDSPDFTLRIAKKVKKLNPKIQTIHLVAPQIWVWRESRIKKIKTFINHMLLLFPFEKKYFDKENINSTFVGHPLLDFSDNSKIDISQIIKGDKKIFSIFPGSRLTEINILMPILIDFIKLMNQRYNDLFFVFHSTSQFVRKIENILINNNLKNCSSISDGKIKSEILKSSIFAVAKSGTISLEICNNRIPSIIIYKMNIVNFLIIKMLVKVRFANIVNIAANREVIPELIQSKCNAIEIFTSVNKILNDKSALDKQVNDTQKIIKDFKTGNSVEIAKSVLINHL